MGAVMQTLYRMKRSVLRRLRWRTRGVKVMLFNADGELLLIRNSYGKSHLYVLPGGGIRPFESPESAALREVREEVGIIAERVTPVSIHVSVLEGKRDTVHLFTAFTSRTPNPDGFEVEEARFFSLECLPETVSAATVRRIAEFRGERSVATAW